MQELTKALLHTRDSFTSACKLLGLDPSWVDPADLDTIMCDACGYWEEPLRINIDSDGTRLCSACNELETLRF